MSIFPIHPLTSSFGANLDNIQLSDLPSASGLRTGTSFAVTDYGGNIATAVGGGNIAGGVWRFEFPFWTTWAGRPPVGLVPAGTELQVTDYGNQKFISDGTYWRPAQGRVLLAQKSRSSAAALAVVSGSAAVQFTLPGGNPKVPAGMVIPGSKLRAEAGVVKSGASSAYGFAARLGKTGITATDLAMGSVASSISADGTGLRMDLVACFAASPSEFFRTGNTVPMGQSTGNMFVSGAPTIDTASDMYVSFDILNGNIADSYSLGFYAVWLEA